MKKPQDQPVLHLNTPSQSRGWGTKRVVSEPEFEVPKESREQQLQHEVIIEQTASNNMPGHNRNASTTAQKQPFLGLLEVSHNHCAGIVCKNDRITFLGAQEGPERTSGHDAAWSSYSRLLPGGSPAVKKGCSHQ